MKDQYRVLVVENIEGLRTQYAKGLRNAGFEVDTAGTFVDAMALVDAKAYHVAIVDLMLHDPEDLSTMEGLDILRRLRELNDGTNSIVVSGQRDPQTVADTREQLGAFQYLTKGKLIDLGLSYLVDQIRKAAEAARLRPFGSAEDVLEFMASASTPNAAILWQDRCLRTLAPANGFVGLQRFFTTWCTPLAPLMPLKDAPSRTELGGEPLAFLRGRFWSKALGQAVELVACRTTDVDRLVAVVRPADAANIAPTSFARDALSGLVFSLPDQPRGMFVERLD